MSFSLKQKEVAYTEDDVRAIAELAGGHPFNIRYAVGLAEHYGVEPFLRDPSLFISWRDKRGEDFISEIVFSDVEEDIIAFLIDYRYLATDAIIGLSDRALTDTMSALRNLQDFCCIEFRDGMFHLAAPIRESARRDVRFKREDDWRKEVAVQITSQIELYKDDDDVPLSLLETVAMAAARSDEAPDYLRALILPSHLLVVAREHYDNKRRELCISVAKQAYEHKLNMTHDAQVECLRLWALAAARAKLNPEYEAAISKLRGRGTKGALRVLAFVEGLKARLDGRDDEAEKHFLIAYELSPTNASVNRELAKLYSGHRDYNEAEQYARQAYATSQTNPFVIDILLETLLGKRARGQSVDESEIAQLLDDLERYGNEPGSSFYQTRLAQSALNSRDYTVALASAREAMQLTPDLPGPYFLMIEAQTRSGLAIEQAEATYTQLKTLLEKIGMSEGEANKLVEAEYTILIEKRQYEGARRLIQQSRRLPVRVAKRLLDALARTVAFDKGGSSSELMTWAQSRLR